MATKLKAPEAKRRRARLVDAWNTGAIPATFGAGSRHISCHHSVVSRWVKENRDGVGDAFHRAQGGFHLDGPPPVPDFITFRKECFGSDTPPHQRAWLDAIQNNDLSLILVPPNHGKTTAIGIEYVVWHIVNDRNVRIMYVSKTQAFARKGLFAVKKRLSDASWYEANGYRNVVTEWGPFKPGQDDRSTPWSADLIYVTGIESAEKDPTVEALGVGNQIYGARADLIVLDDIATITNQQSEVERSKQLDWIVQEVMTRLSQDGKLIIIGTRVREYDIYSTLLDQDVDWANDFRPVVQPAIVSEEGELSLWPEQRPFDLLVRKYRYRMPARLWNLVYMQQASGAVDQPFTEDALERAKTDRYRAGQPIPNLTVVMGVDPALAGTLAIAVVGYDRETKERFVLDCPTLTNFQQPEVGKRLIIDTAARFGAVRARIEKNAMQGWLTKDHLFRRQLLGVGCQLEEEYTSAHNKFDPDWGVGSVAAEFDAGLWHIPWTPDSQTRMRPLVEELAVWRPGVKVKQDRVMALWLADLQIRQLGTYRPGVGMPTRNPNMPAWVKNMKVPGWVRQRQTQHLRVPS